MKIYNKYIIRTILPLFILVTLLVTSMVWIIRMLNLTSLIEKGLSIIDFANVAIYLLPYLLYIILPIISLISTIFIYAKLQDEKQLIVLRSGGLSDFLIIKPALYLVFAVTIFSYFLSLYLIPVSYSKLAVAMNKFKENYVVNIIKENTFNQFSRHITLYVNNKTSASDFEGVTLYSNESEKKEKIYYAKYGRINEISENIFELELNDGIQYFYDNNGKMTKLFFDRINININNKHINKKARRKNSVEMFIGEMFNPKQDISQSQKNALQVDAHSRLIWPIYNFLFTFTALVIFIKWKHSRKVDIWQYIYSIIPTIIAAYIHFTCKKLAYNNIYFIYGCYSSILFWLLSAILLMFKRRL